MRVGNLVLQVFDRLAFPLFLVVDAGRNHDELDVGKDSLCDFPNLLEFFVVPAAGANLAWSGLSYLR